MAPRIGMYLSAATVVACVSLPWLDPDDPTGPLGFLVLALLFTAAFAVTYVLARWASVRIEVDDTSISYVRGRFRQSLLWAEADHIAERPLGLGVVLRNKDSSTIIRVSSCLWHFEELKELIKTKTIYASRHVGAGAVCAGSDDRAVAPAASEDGTGQHHQVPPSEYLADCFPKIISFSGVMALDDALEAIRLNRQHHPHFLLRSVSPTQWLVALLGILIGCVLGNLLPETLRSYAHLVICYPLLMACALFLLNEAMAFFERHRYRTAWKKGLFPKLTGRIAPEGLDIAADGRANHVEWSRFHRHVRSSQAIVLDFENALAAVMLGRSLFSSQQDWETFTDWIAIRIPSRGEPWPRGPIKSAL